MKKALIIGAGPAGLTAAYELLSRAGIQAIVIEKSEYMGGISRTVNYKGNRIDIGGHRFFSKSDRVMKWWLQMLPVEGGTAERMSIQYRGMERTVPFGKAGSNPETDDLVMLLRPRKSRIYYLRNFFDYPIRPSATLLSVLGFWRTLRIGASYCKSLLFPIRPEQTLEHFFINRFGMELYRTFFKSYTEKVWGVPCERIDADWGAQRIKGLSIKTALLHAGRKIFKREAGEIGRKDVETSLIEHFLYPKFGPGQL